MAEFKEGDLVEGVKGESVIRGRVVDRAWFLGIEGAAGIKYYERVGWTLAVIDRPKPKVELPSEPGVYRDRDGDTWLLSTRRGWAYVMDDGSGLAQSNRTASFYVPFTRLEPVPVTAKKVLGRFRDVFLTSNQSTLKNIAQVAAEFGVTD